MGFPPLVFLACSSFNTLYQFWIHTREISTLGPLEQVLMTPSHHRVHHGRNPIYIDRNHGGTFIVWDKLFGTFEAESEEVVYGVTKPLASWNPIWANLDYWVDLARAARATRRWRDKLLVFLERPGWLPEDLGGFQSPPPVAPGVLKYDPAVESRVAAYATLQFLQVLALSLAFSALRPGLALPAQLLGGIGVVWGLTNVGGLFDGARWARAPEWARVLVTPVAVLFLVPAPLGPIAGVALLTNPVFALLAGLRRHPDAPSTKAAAAEGGTSTAGSSTASG